MKPRDPTEILLQKMAGFDLDPKTIIWDGRRHRFPGAGKTRGTDAWYLAYPDRMGAHFGDWSTGIKEHWTVQRDKPFTKAEKNKWAEEKKKRDLEEKEKRAKALQEIKTVWDAAKLPGKKLHAYLFNKGIDNSPNLRISTLTDLGTWKIPAGLLLMPMYKRKKMVNLQRVWPNGKKRWWPGAEVIGARVVINPNGGSWDRVYVCEGWANGWTINRATGCPVVVAFTAGNLLPVAKDAEDGSGIRSALIIAADNDRWKRILTDGGEIPNPRRPLRTARREGVRSHGLHS